MKRVLVVLGHPSKKSLCKSIAKTYIENAKKFAEVRKIFLDELKFDLVLHEGYNKEQKLEKDLVRFQELIKWAEHVVFVFPIWWGGMPAILKGFIDRTILPGFAFKYNKRGSHDKLLKGKTASLIITGGGPRLVYLFFGWFLIFPMKVAIFNFVGFRVKKIKIFSSVRKISEKRAQEIFRVVRKLAEMDSRV